MTGQGAGYPSDAHARGLDLISTVRLQALLVDALSDQPTGEGFRGVESLQPVRHLVLGGRDAGAS